MNPNGMLARMLRPLAKALEGTYRQGPYALPVTGGILSADAGQYMNWWQLGYDVTGSGKSAIVEACIAAYSQTVAMCPGDHWRLNNKNGRTRVTNSAVSRILRRPNAYQSISDFLLNLTDSLYRDGNAYALGLRNDRSEISELHLMDPRISKPQLAVNGDIFYRLAGNDVVQNQLEENEQLVVPQRDVLHIRLRHERHRIPRPLVGESPLMSALLDIAQTDAIAQQQINFFLNQARPSAVLTTDQLLNREQADFLRDRWDEQSKGINQGKTPILSAGLKVQPWGDTKDIQIADIAKMSDQRIALAFRIPLQILGLGGTPFASAELLMQSWIALGLGFCLNHVEESFGMLFGLKGQPDEYIAFDTDALQRSALKDRIDALVRGVQGGVYSPNEAREREGLDAVPYGDEPRVQQQVVPLSQIGKAPSPAAPPSPTAPPTAPKDYHANGFATEVRRLQESAARARRRIVG
jgi:HK97 family phage portal protein